MNEMNIVEYLFIIVCLNHRLGVATLDCDFDKDFCEWRQDDNDDFDWNREDYNTLSWSTGPTSDHTTGYGHYIYIEASKKDEGEKARIISPMQRSGQYCLTFWYNMYGKDIGALNVYLAASDNETVIFNKEKNIGNRSWWKSGLSIKTTESFQIIFEGVIGYDSKGDIAIDDINMDIGLCSLDCNFDTNFCGWYFDPSSDFAWERQSYKTSSPSTGPTSDHTTGNDYYIYIEATSNDEGEKSRLVSPVQLPGQYCLTFWYSMYGEDIGSLNVYKAMNGIETIIFTKDEDIGKPDLWKAVLTIMANETFQFVFEGVIGNGYRGDIAIDDISLKSGLCSLDCDFDINFCNWMQSYDDDFDWNHATSNSGNGFIYTKAHYENGTAMLISPLHNAGKYCLSFFYFMVGWKYQTLQLQLWERNGSKKVLDSLQSPVAQHKRIFISSRHLFQIVFEGKVHTLDTKNGEIRMDDVTISSCHDCVDPTPSHGTLNSTNFMYGSVIKIQCDHGYILKGKSVIVCETMGIWNGTAECILYDCGNLTIPNGTFITPNGTTYGQIGKHVCDTGFVLIGEKRVRCTVDGWSNTSAYCKIIDCGNHTLQNGRFITANGTTFGQVGRQKCNIGFDLIGEQNLTCTVNGWSNTSAYCKIIDCGNLTLDNGTFITETGTTFGQVGRQECDTGFVLVGEQSIRCTVNGWSNTSAYCKMIDIVYSEPDSSSLVAVYVLTPVIVLIVAALIIVVYIRRRHPSCIQTLKTDKNSRNEPTNVSLGGQSHSNHTYSNEVDQLDEEYATIAAEEQDRNDGLHTVYYTTVNKKSTKKLGETQPGSVNKTVGEGFRNGFKDINALSTEDHNILSESNEEQDYDSACTGKINSKPLNYDDYAHLGDLDMEYQHPFNLNMQTDMQTNTDYSHIDEVNTNSSPITHVEGNNSNVYQNSIENEKKNILGEHIQKIKDSKDHESDYYNVRTDVEDTDTEGCFVLQDEERNNESDGFEKHEYFILEKM